MEGLGRHRPVSRSVIKTCEDSPCSRCRRRRARISSPCIGWTLGEPFFALRTCSRPVASSVPIGRPFVFPRYFARVSNQLAKYQIFSSPVSTGAVGIHGQPWPEESRPYGLSGRVGPPGPLDRVAQTADRKYCRPQARSSALASRVMAGRLAANPSESAFQNLGGWSDDHTQYPVEVANR